MMIRGFVTIALGGALLVIGAGPACAASPAPRPSAQHTSADRSIESHPATPAPEAKPAHAERDGGDIREASATGEALRGLAPPHPFREQVLPEARV